MRVFLVFLLVSAACGQYGATYAWNGEVAYPWANLNGSHYQITVVHDGVAVDVGVDDGLIRPKNQWKGFMIDMIYQIAMPHHANFTYELFLPSGNSSACPDGGPLDNAVAWGCGEQDVSSLNLTDAYWSTFYMTPQRISNGVRFTPPFLTNMGYTMAVKVVEQGAYTSDNLFKMFKPFSPALWGVSVVVLLFVSVVYYLVEQLTKPHSEAKQKLQMMKMSAETWSRTDMEQLLQTRAMVPSGLFSFERFPRYLSAQWQVLIQQNYLGQGSKTGLLIIMSWCVFSLVWISFYTSQLTALLSTESMSPQYVDIQALDDDGATACVLAGAAYVPEVAYLYPNIKLVHNSTGAGVRLMEEGGCDALIFPYQDIRGILYGALDLDPTASHRRCSTLTLIAPDRPALTGFQNFAVGVRRDQEVLWRALSFWINSLRTCSPYSRDSACYRGRPWAVNLMTLFDSWFAPNLCPAVKLETESNQLSATNMLLPTALTIALVIGCVVVSRVSNMKHIPLQDVEEIDVVLRKPFWATAWSKEQELDIVFSNSIHMATLVGLWQQLTEETEDQLIPAVKAYLLENDLHLYFLFQKSLESYSHVKQYIENHQDDDVPDVYQGIEQEQAKLQKIKDKLDFIVEKVIRSRYEDSDVSLT